MSVGISCFTLAKVTITLLDLNRFVVPATIAGAVAGIAATFVAVVGLRAQSQTAQRTNYLTELRFRREQWDSDKWRTIRRTAAQTILAKQQNQATAELELFLYQAAVYAEKAAVRGRELDFMLPDDAFAFWAGFKAFVYRRDPFAWRGRTPLDRVMIRQYRSWYSWFDRLFSDHAANIHNQIMLYLPQEAGWKERADYISPIAIDNSSAPRICTYTLRVRGPRARRQALL